MASIGSSAAPFSPQLVSHLIVSAQLAAASAMLIRRDRFPSGRAAAALPAAAGVLAFAACLAAPGVAASLGALGRLAIYGGLLRLFGRSLRPGCEPVATRLARRIHGSLTPGRIAYTRSVTWMWAGFFAMQLAASVLLLAIAPRHPPPWLAVWTDLPLVGLLLAAELAVRAWWFRGQPHGSARDMLRMVARGEP